MYIQQKLTILKNCSEQGYSHSSQLSLTNPDLLKSCLYHFKQLNHTISHQLSLLSESCSNTKNNMLPVIKNKNTRNSQNLSPKALIKKAKHLLQNQKSKITSTRSVCIRPINENKNAQKERANRIRVRAVNQNQLFLKKEQRYFQLKKVSVQAQDVKKLGIYESINIFKTKNLKDQINQLMVIAEKPQFNPIKLIKKNDIFLTNIGIEKNSFSLQGFIQEQLQRDNQCGKVVAQCESIRPSKQSNLSDLKAFLKQIDIQVTPIYITFNNYRVFEDDQYKLLKVKYMQNWGAMFLNLQYICNGLKQHKIIHFVVKQSKLHFWQGQKYQRKSTGESLQLPSNTIYQKTNRKVLVFRDKLKVAIIKRKIQHKQNLARWVSQRIKILVSIRKDKEYKIQRALSLQNKWANGQFFPQIQVRIPSFSVQVFKRNTTQYMESFQALYHSLWEPTDLPLVLVLPTINEYLLKMLQSRIKICRPITIITPEVHEVFPKNLSLSSQINFSYQTLNKIEKATAGKQAVLFGGIYDNPTQQLLISQFLNAPFCGCSKQNSVLQQKKFFQKVGLKKYPFCIIQPKSTFESLLKKLSQLFLTNSEDKSWIFKINNEFRGRGIAKFRYNPSKHINRQQKQDLNKLFLQQSLRSMLRLKLKVNFENSLYMVEDYLSSLLQKGGVIQQLLEVSHTYEICFRKEVKCELLSIFKVYGINFANKVWLSVNKYFQLTSLISKIQAEIQSSNLLGYLSITLARQIHNQFVGIDLKFGQTPPSNLTSYIKMVDRKRANTLGTEAFNLIELPTKRTQKEEIKNQSLNNLLNTQSYRYVFIPTFPFTDINQTTKSLLIQQLMQDCWAKQKFKITDEGVFYFSLGLDFSALVVSKELKKLKKMGIDLVRELTDKTSNLRQYRGKQVLRDVFQYGDVIRAISQIKNDD